MCEQIRGDFLMTYDNAAEVCALAKRHGFQFRPVAMKNTHHAEMTELLIGKDLSWMDEHATVREEPGPVRKSPKKPKNKVRYRAKTAKKKPNSEGK